MKDSTKLILVGGVSFLLGAGLSGAGVYFYTKRYFEEKTQEEIQSMGEYYISKYGEEKEDEDDKPGDKEKSDSKEQAEAKVQSDYEDISDIYKSKSDESDRINTSYSGYYDSSSGRGSTKRKNSKKKKKEDIEIVESEVWDENPGNFDTMFLVYYDADGTLVDEETEQIFDGGLDDKDDIIKAIESGDPDGNGVLIVQSNFTKILYHITVEQMAYTEAMLDD